MERGTIRGFLSILGSQISLLLLGLIITPLLVQIVGSSVYGNYAFVISILSLTMILANAGLFDGTRKYIAESRDREGWAEHVFGFYLRVGMVLAAIFGMGYATLAWVDAPAMLLDPEFTRYFYFLAGLILASQLASISRSGLMGIGQEHRSEPLQVLKKVLFGVVGLGLALQGFGIVGLLVGELVATVVIAVAALVLLGRQLNPRRVLAPTPSGFPRLELLSFNILSVVLVLLTASLYHVDILLLRPIAGSRSTGYYRAALTIAEFIWFVPNVVQTALLHSSSEMWSEGATEEIAELVSRVTRYGLSLTLLLALGLAALAGDFLPLYFGAEFSASVTPLLLLLPGALGFALARPIFSVGQGKGEIRVLILATGTAALLNLVLNLLLIPRYGPSGAAVATSIGYGSMFVLHTAAARRIGFDPISDLRLGRTLAVAALSAPVVFGGVAVIDSPLVSLLVVPPLGFLVYALLTIRLSVIEPEELEGIVDRLPAPLADYGTRLLPFLYRLSG